MPTTSLPLEICRHIIDYADPPDLPALALTCRALQPTAEAIIYETLDLLHGPMALHLCLLFSGCRRVAEYVKHFGLLHDNRARRNIPFSQQTWHSDEYWDSVSVALSRMGKLEDLYIVDPGVNMTWILGANPMFFKLKTARLFMPWDPYVVGFLEDQDQLQSLSVTDLLEDVPRAPLSQQALTHLNKFEGPLILVDQLFHCPITHLRVPIDHEDAISLLPIVIPELTRFQALISLSIVMIPEELAVECVHAIAKACPRLRYLSHIPLPSDHQSRLEMMQSFAKMHDLAIIETDHSHWTPRPLGPFQRMVVSELRLYCPSLHGIVLWMGTDRYTWQWHGPVAILGSPEQVFASEVTQWQNQWHQPSWPLTTNIWKTAV